MQVSVALCTYNGDQYIEQQLESILNQTAELYEIVISDDCSTDSTIDKLREYEQEYPNLIKLYSNDVNLGIVENFSRCINRCSGDVIAISDQDDIWDEEKIEREIKIYSQKDVSLVFHNSTIVTDSLKPQGNFWSSARYRVPKCVNQPYLLQALTKQNFVQGCTMLFDSDLKDYILPIPDEWKYDYYISVIAAIKGRLYAIDDELLLYRQHDRQAIGSPEKSTVKQVNYWIQNSLAMDRHTYHEKEAKKWKDVLQIERDIGDTSPQASEIIRGKYLFEKNRAKIYDPAVGVQRSIENIGANWRSGKYEIYVDNPRIHAMKDLLSAFLVSVSSRIA